VIMQIDIDRMWRDGVAAICEAAELQSHHQIDSEPTAKFRSLLSAALASGRCHIADPYGQAPMNREDVCGWREKDVRRGDILQPILEPQGKRIGWIDGDEVYLEPGAAFAEVQSLAMTQGDGFPVTQQTLIKRLKEKNLLASTDDGRKRNTIRKMLGGGRREVLHLKAATLSPPAETVPTVPSGQNTVGNGTVLRDSFQDGTKNRPTEPSHSEPDSPPMGQLGRSGTTDEGEVGENSTHTGDAPEEGVV